MVKDFVRKRIKLSYWFTDSSKQEVPIDLPSLIQMLNQRIEVLNKTDPSGVFYH